MSDPLKIVSLTAENVKRLHAVEIRPDGSTVVIGGRNGAGKSSVLDAIAAALGGKREAPKVPIRDGEERAEVVVDLGDITVTRRWTESGSSLVVANRDGARYPSPQTMLDGLVGRLAFDPLAFMREDPRRQADTLRDLVGLDTTEIDERAKALYEERRDVNRDLKAARARLDAAPYYEGVDRVDLADLLKRHAELVEQNATTRRKHEHVERARAEVDRTTDDFERLKIAADAEVKRFERLLEEAKKERERVIASCDEAHRAAARALNAAEREAAECEEIDLGAIEEEIRTAENRNRRADENDARDSINDEVESLDAQSRDLTVEIEKAAAKRQAMIRDAAFPVDGLALAEDGVTLNGLPLDQASSAEQLRVSVAMGLAANPRLKILLIRDGSLLDPDSLAAVAKMADEAGGQLWIERVSEGEECTVVIEDGSVRGG